MKPTYPLFLAIVFFACLVSAGDNPSLKKPVTQSFEDESVADVLYAVAKSCDVSLVIDRRLLDDNGDTDPTVTVRFKAVPLKDALKKILTPLKWGYFIEEGVIVVTDEETASRLRKKLQQTP